MVENDKARWREAMEKLGPTSVRWKLRDNAGIGGGAEVRYIGAQPWPSRVFVEEWLGEKEQEAFQRDRRMIRIARLGTVAGLLGEVLSLTALVHTWWK